MPRVAKPDCAPKRSLTVSANPDGRVRLLVCRDAPHVIEVDQLAVERDGAFPRPERHDRGQRLVGQGAALGATDPQDLELILGVRRSKRGALANESLAAI